VPTRPILSLLADDCGLYHHLTCTALSPFRCSTMPSLHSRDDGARSLTVMPHAEPLLPPSLLTLRAARLASSSLAPCRVGTMHWHTHARRVALSSATPWPAHLSQRRMDKHPPRRLHARPLPLRHHCCALLRARALLLLYRRAEPSPPSFPSCAGPCCPHAMHGYKRRPFPFI
jgi:hypothetical protein